MTARIELQSGNAGEAEVAAQEAYALAETTGDQELLRTPTHVLAGVAMVAGDLQVARTRLTHSLELAARLGDDKWVAVEQLNLSDVVLSLGDAAAARILLDRCAQWILDNGESLYVSALALRSARLAEAEGENQTAARLLGMVDSVLRAAGTVLRPGGDADRDRLRQTLIEALGRDAFDREYAVGTVTDPGPALAARHTRPAPAS